MKLYYSPGACSLSPHIVALEAGLALELQKVDTKTKTARSEGDFWKVNPKGYVPALEIAPGEVLTEGPAIVQYLGDQKPHRGLGLRSIPPVDAQHSRFEQPCLGTGKLEVRLGVLTRFSARCQVNALCVYSGLRMKSLVCKILLIVDQLGI